MMGKDVIGPCPPVKYAMASSEKNKSLDEKTSNIGNYELNQTGKKADLKGPRKILGYFIWLH